MLPESLFGSQNLGMVLINQRRKKVESIKCGDSHPVGVGCAFSQLGVARKLGGYMKLKETITEQQFRKELQASKIRLFNDTTMSRFLSIIKGTFPDIKTAYILYWIPEQGEDIITFLVDTHSVIEIELDRFNHKIDPIFEVYPLEWFIKGLSKWNQIKIAVALDLATKDIKQRN